MKVGFIGLGDQGGPMAEVIAAAGHTLYVWARRKEALAQYVARGAIACDEPAELAGLVDHLGLCVLAEGDVRELLLDRGVLAKLKPGSVIAIHTTMAPEGCRRLAAVAAERGVDLIDAPVSGGREAALVRRLLALVGGEPAAVQKAMPVLRSYADRVLRIGPVGAGQTAKILNNLLLNANLAAAHFVLEYGQALGLDRAQLRAILLQGTAASTALDWLDRAVVPGRHPATLGRKDIQLALDLATATAVPAEIQIIARSALRGREVLEG
jgi:3-hydroxyisobutyrate dehydrogenase